jgi:hypothetical protein
MAYLRAILTILKYQGWRVVVTTWLAKGGTNEYNDRTRKAKLDWLEKYRFPYDEIHLVKYGTTKANCTRKLKGYQVLVDDNEKIRKGWHLGATIDPTKDLIVSLLELLSE